MVQAGRLACIFTPFALSIASLVCIIIVLLGGNSTKNATLDDLYFFKVSLHTFHPRLAVFDSYATLTLN